MSIENTKHQGSPQAIPSPSNEALTERMHGLEEEIRQVKARRKSRNEKAERSPSFQDVSERLRKFIQSNLIPVLIADIDGRIYDLNDAVEILLGYTKEELKNGPITWHQLTPPESRAISEAKALEMVSTGKAVTFEKEYIHKDGHRVPVLLSASPLGENSKLAVTYYIDLTERKKLESELKASEAKFKLLSEAVPQIVWVTDSRGQTKYSNQRFYDLTGLKKEDDDGFLWLTIVHPDDKETYVREAAKAGREILEFDHETRFRMADGSYRWQLVRGVPIPDPDSGEYLWFGTCTDIDDQRRLSDDVKEREVEFRTLADAIPQIVFTAGPSGNLEYFNHRWFEYTGLTEEQSRKDAWQLLIHPDDLPAYLSGWQNAQASGDSYELEFRLKGAVGHKTDASSHGYRRHLARAVALRGRDGEILKWFATWTDIENQASKNKFPDQG